FDPPSLSLTPNPGKSESKTSSSLLRRGRVSLVMAALVSFMNALWEDHGKTDGVVSCGLVRPIVRRYLRFFRDLQGPCGFTWPRVATRQEISNPQVAGSSPAGDAK